MSCADDRHEDERYTDQAIALFTADDEFPRDPPPPPIENVLRDLADYHPTT